MDSAVIVFPGSNREHDIADAVERASGRRPRHVWHAETELPPVDLVLLPGGFAYGDYLRCGAMAARSPVMKAVAEHAAAGRYVLGVCNGFQVLTEAGLLPGALMRNASLKFVCRDVTLKVVEATSAFTHGYDQGAIVTFPVAHAEGNYSADEETLKRLEGDGRVAFRYVDAEGQPVAAASPNGALNNIAGILNERRNVLGMMPHPENRIEPAQGGSDGLTLFESLVKSFG
ncbi:phosphoribosylformylglycinamidine synthase subunit PurQ [Zavarzinia sp. CC-PAN008]|uniref:phosphoribosylformylglycinamidine synthase subunit PurQ n=1 Tax=Zavarzinia sp. CC-PAN008 TaxID=3243332 RepID=UPI003F746419